jgi:hypothetical protein
LLALAAAVVVAVVLLTGGDDAKRSQQASGIAKESKPAATTSQSPTAAAPRLASPAPAAPATPAPTVPASSGRAAKTLTDFYTRAANHDVNGAWALGTDNLHAQFKGSLAIFRSTVATLQSIQFPSLRIASQTGSAATIEFSSIAKHTDRTDRCSGQATMVRQAKQWLVDHIGVSCTS